MGNCCCKRRSNLQRRGQDRVFVFSSSWEFEDFDEVPLTPRVPPPPPPSPASADDSRGVPPPPPPPAPGTVTTKPSPSPYSPDGASTKLFSSSVPGGSRADPPVSPTSLFCSSSMLSLNSLYLSCYIDVTSMQSFGSGQPAGNEEEMSVTSAPQSSALEHEVRLPTSGQTSVARTISGEDETHSDLSFWMEMPLASLAESEIAGLFFGDDAIPPKSFNKDKEIK